jgi:hypothetical protein
MPCCRWVSQEQAAGGEGGGEEDAPSGISPWELWRVGTSEEIVVYELGTMNRWVGGQPGSQAARAYHQLLRPSSCPRTSSCATTPCCCPCNTVTHQ